jgi:hypothetical protein
MQPPINAFTTDLGVPIMCNLFACYLKLSDEARLHKLNKLKGREEKQGVLVAFAITIDEMEKVYAFCRGDIGLLKGLCNPLKVYSVIYLRANNQRKRKFSSLLNVKL